MLHINFKRGQEAIISYFWEGVDIKSPDECWEWKRGTANKNGPWQYGIMWANGERHRCHRFALAIKLGRPIGAKMLACHTCDNPICCNPDHLYEGTHKDNTRDCKSRSRLNRERGSARYNSVLTEADIRFIRRNFSSNRGKDGKLTGTALAKQFKVGPTMISSIVNRHRWKHVE